MNSARPVFIAVGLVLGGQLAFAQDVSRYRAYALESSLDSVVAATGARAVDAKRCTSGLQQFKSWNGVRRTSIRATRWPIALCVRLLLWIGGLL
jgi:hypothetical protein